MTGNEKNVNARNDLIEQLTDLDPITRENACEQLNFTSDLTLVPVLISIASNDESEHVRFDAFGALIRMCFARPTPATWDPQSSKADWWNRWWSIHSQWSHDQLFADRISRYLINLAQNSDEYANDEITLGLALDIDPGVWPKKQDLFRAFATSLFDVLQLTETKASRREVLSNHLRPFCAHFLRNVALANGYYASPKAV